MSQKEDKAGNRVQMAVDMIELALWDLTSVNHFNFIPGHRKNKRLGSQETKPSLHYVGCSYHIAALEEGRPYQNAYSICQITMLSGEEGGRAFAGNCVKSHPSDKSGFQVHFNL